MCKRRKLRVNESKSKVTKCTRMVDDWRMNFTLKGKLLEKVECFRYFDGRIEGEVKLRVNKIRKVCGRLKRMFKCRSLGMNAKRRLFEGIVVPKYCMGLRLSTSPSLECS